jgi:hypothetical protein
VPKRRATVEWDLAEMLLLLGVLLLQGAVQAYQGAPSQQACMKHAVEGGSSRKRKLKN